MTPHDFCVWLAGFAEGVTDHPSPEQWQRITAQVNSVLEKSTTRPAVTSPVLPDKPGFIPTCWPAKSEPKWIYGDPAA